MCYLVNVDKYGRFYLPYIGEWLDSCRVWADGLFADCVLECDLHIPEEYCSPGLVVFSDYAVAVQYVKNVSQDFVNRVMGD